MVGLGLATALMLAGCTTATSGHVADDGARTGVGLRIALGSSFVNGRFKGSSTCDDPGHDYSPELEFEQSNGSGSLALTMVDLYNAKVHWIQTGIPGDAHGIDEHTLVSGAREWTNDLGEATYDGPCPPPGETHRYRLTLYTLPSPIDLTASDTPTARVRELERVASSRASAEASYSGAS